jgi:hypothetical protein
MCKKKREKKPKQIKKESQTRHKNARKNAKKGIKKGIKQMKKKNARRLPKTPNLPKFGLEKRHLAALLKSSRTSCDKARRGGTINSLVRLLVRN